MRLALIRPLRCLLEEVADAATADGYFADEFLGDKFYRRCVSYFSEGVFGFVEEASSQAFELPFVVSAS